MTKPLTLKNTSRGLAGALAIAGGTAAYGDIVQVATPGDYSVMQGTNDGSPATVPYDPNFAGDRAWDVDNNGSNDFFFRLRWDFPPDANDLGVVWQATMNPFTNLAATNGLVQYGGIFALALDPLDPNATVGPGAPFSTVNRIVLGSRFDTYGVSGLYGGFAGGPNAYGSVTPGTVAFAGFRFNAPDGTHYGWVELSVDQGTIHFVDAAYQSTPNTPIQVGAIPEPSTLALLAVGAAGVVGAVAKRRRK